MKQISFINSRRRVISEGFPEFSVGGGGGHPKMRAGRSSQSLAASSLELGAGVKRVLTVSHWLSAGTSSSWRVVGLFLMIFSLLLLVGCGGGSGSGGSGGDGDSGSSPKAELSIIPFTGGLEIEWHNLANYSQSDTLESVSLNIIPQGSEEAIGYPINISDFVDGIYNLTRLGATASLVDGRAYKFTSLVLEYSDGSTLKLGIAWQLDVNEEDHGDDGEGTVVGTDYDRDGRSHFEDKDDDNDMRPDTDDDCVDGPTGWNSLNRGEDNDEDGCRDEDEDPDDDNDRLLDNHSTELLTNTDGVRCSLLSDCDGDRLLDNHTFEQSQNGDGIFCLVLRSCDGDYLDDSRDMCPLGNEDWTNDGGTNDNDGDGCRDEDEDPDDDNDRLADIDELAGCEHVRDCDNDGVQDGVDIDEDGDGLIEIRNASELDAVRYQLNGKGSRRSMGEELNTLGCGNGTNTGDISSCSGYELVRNISLTDYIVEQNATAGWQPIAHDIIVGGSGDCDGSAFTGIFDGNGFVISGLFINRSDEDCIGLFGHVNLATIRHLGVVVDRVVGKGAVGGLVGSGEDIELIQSYVVNERVRSTAGPSGSLIGGASRVKITQSYAVNGEVHGNDLVGGLVGLVDHGKIIHSYAVSKIVRGNWGVGGLMGYGISTSIIHSHAVNGIVKGSLSIGGLVGSTETSTLIVQTYAVSDQVDGSDEVGGLVGYSTSTSIIHSYTLSGTINGTSSIGGLLGKLEGNVEVRSSYWDNETSGRNNDGATGSMGQTSMTLRSPISYGNEGIYSTWDDGIMAESIDDQSTIWCDEDSSGTIEADEMRANNHVWDFGTSSDYPALRCVGDSLADQRAWWHLNTTSHKPQLNQTVLDAWLDGSLP